MLTEKEKIYNDNYYIKNREKFILYSKKWYKENKESKRIYNKKYKREHKQYFDTYMKEYRIKNRDKLIGWRKEYKEKNKERVKLSHKVSKHRRRSAGKLSVKLLQSVYEDNIKKYGTLTCYLCEKPIPFGQDNLEHKFPISRGGRNNYENLAVACALCNHKKKNKTLEEYLGVLPKKL